MHTVVRFLHCLTSRPFPQPRKLSNARFTSHLLIMPRSHAHRDCRLEFYHWVILKRMFYCPAGHRKDARAYLQPGQSTPRCISRCGTGAGQLRKFTTVLGTGVTPTYSLSPKAQLALLGCFRFLLGVVLVSRGGGCGGGGGLACLL